MTISAPVRSAVSATSKMRKPLLFIPNRDFGLGKGKYFFQPAPPSVSGASQRMLTQSQWALLANQCPKLMQQLLRLPNDQQALEKLVLHGEGYLFGKYKQMEWIPPDRRFESNDPIDITTPMDIAKLASILHQVEAGGQWSRVLHVIYEPKSGQYRVEFRKPSGLIEGSSLDRMLLGAWSFSNLSNGVRDQCWKDVVASFQATLTSEEFIKSVDRGARILFIPGDTGLIRPQLVGLSEAQNDRGERLTQFNIPNSVQTHPMGSAVALTLNGMQESFTTGELIDRMERDATAAHERGQTPAAALDLDGTLFNARVFVWQLFKEWIEKYDGPDAAEIRCAAKGKMILDAWDVGDVLAKLDFGKHFAAYDSVKAHDKKKLDARDGVPIDDGAVVWQQFNEWLEQYDGADVNDIRKAAERTAILDASSCRNILDRLGFGAYIEAYESSMAYHKIHFYSPERRKDVPLIEGTVLLIQELKRRLKAKGIHLKTVFFTLRSAKQDVLSDGITSSAEIALRRAGIWDDASEIVRYTGKKDIDWTKAAFEKNAEAASASQGSGEKKKGNEPPKWYMVKLYMKRMARKMLKKKLEKKPWFFAVIDNAPDHLNGYLKYFGHTITIVHVRDDNPPKSPPLREGIFTIDPKQVARDLKRGRRIRGRKLVA